MTRAAGRSGTLPGMVGLQVAGAAPLVENRVITEARAMAL